MTGAAGVEIAGAVTISEAEAEGVMELLVFGVQFRRDQQLHRGDLLLRMARQMLGIIAPHEAGIGLVAGCARIHARVEGLGLGLAGLTDIVGLLGVSSAAERGKEDGRNEKRLHDGLACSN